MNYREEIEYREMLINKAAVGEKLSSDERSWLVTHPIYNRKLGYPYSNVDIIQIESNREYSVCVKCESSVYPGWIIPIIGIPGGKGVIKTDFDLFDINLKLSSKKTTKMLGVPIDSKNNKASFWCKSKLGKLQIGYQCEYFDHKQKVMIRKSSFTGDPDFAMRKQYADKNKVFYYCKSPINDLLDSFVFSIELGFDN